MRASNEKEAAIVLTGKVTQKKFGPGSKSEHNAVYLETTEASYVLRRVGGNAFHDPGLEKWKGKNVIATGVVSDYLFLARDIKACADESHPAKKKG